MAIEADVSNVNLLKIVATNDGVSNNNNHADWADAKLTPKWNETVEDDPFGYCGEYYDAELEMVYLRNRYYSPSIGRFITEDPIKDGLNWYAYANNNPIMFIDPSGCLTIEDGVYSSQVQQQLIDYSLDYLNEKRAGNTVAMNRASLNATDLRLKSKPQNFWGRLLDDKAAKMENNMILADIKAKSLGFKKGSDEYAEVFLAYTIMLNDIDERGEVRYRNQLMVLALFRAGEIVANEMTRINNNIRVVTKHSSGANPLDKIKYTGKVKKQMENTSDLYHAFPIQVDRYGATGVKSVFTGGDGIEYTKIQIPGSVNNVNGVFEYIFNNVTNECNHRLFVPFN